MEHIHGLNKGFKKCVSNVLEEVTKIEVDRILKQFLRAKYTESVTNESIIHILWTSHKLLNIIRKIISQFFYHIFSKDRRQSREIDKPDKD